MSPRPTPIPPSILEQASEWLITLREPTAPATTHAQFADWLRASPQHICAYLQVAGMWVDLAQLPRDLPTDFSSSDLVPFPTPTREPSQREPRTLRFGEWRQASLAAACVLAVLAAGGFAWRLWASTYSTGIDEQRAITLQDGSRVRLNSHSRIRVHFSPPRREIDLLEGQALFEVAKDPARPFIVTSGPVAVRAVGTQFDVNRKAAGTVVTVLEGRVAVQMKARQPSRTGPPSSAADTRAGNISPPVVTNNAPPAQATSASDPKEGWLVLAGEQLTVTASGAVEPQHPADIAATTGWLREELTFSGEPLSEVVEEFNRHSRRPIVITDPTLARSRISAVFHSTNPESLIRYLRRLEGVEVEETATEIRISRRPPP